MRRLAFAAVALAMAVLSSGCHGREPVGVPTNEADQVMQKLRGTLSVSTEHFGASQVLAELEVGQCVVRRTAGRSGRFVEVRRRMNFPQQGGGAGLVAIQTTDQFGLERVRAVCSVPAGAATAHEVMNALEPRAIPQPSLRARARSLLYWQAGVAASSLAGCDEDGNITEGEVCEINGLTISVCRTDQYMDDGGECWPLAALPSTFGSGGEGGSADGGGSSGSGGGSSPGDPPPPDPAPQDSAEADLGANPWGCRGSTDNPHNSSHYPGTVNAVGRTQCDTGPPRLFSVIALQRWTCLAGFCWWSDVGAGSDIEYNVSFLAVNAATACVDGSYQGLTLHFASSANVLDFWEAVTLRRAPVICPV